MGGLPKEDHRCFESTASEFCSLRSLSTYASRLYLTEIRPLIDSLLPRRMVRSTLFHTSIIRPKRFSPQTHFVDKPRELFLQSIIPNER